ncbi:MAG: hypothetical protein DRP46_01935, partial [Candidatus Zixiibacteriota bacterium]
MDIVRIIFFAFGAAVCGFFALFAYTSLREQKPRAATVSAIILILFGLTWFGGYYYLEPSPAVMLYAAGTVALFVIFFFIPLGQRHPIETGIISGKVDERDVAFAREEYLPGSEKYNQYYAMRPE